MNNQYTISEEVVTIHISRKNGDKHTTKVSLVDLPVLLSLNRCYISVAPNKNHTCARISYRNEEGQYIQQLLHRFLLNAPNGIHVDHIDHNPLNNCRDNLRLATNAQNIQNLTGARSDSRSGVRGVTWRDDSKSWYAHCQVNGKRHFLGRYKSLDEAEKVVRNFRAINMPFSQEARELENPVLTPLNHTPGKKNKSSGIKGISWSKHHNKWHVQIYHNRKIHRLGFYKDLEKAIEVADKFRADNSQ